MANAKRDDNFVTTLLAVSSVDGVTPVTLYANPTTHRLLVDLAGGAGTVQTISIATANGFAGSSDGDPTNPALTISTTITGILKGNGTAISAVTIGSGLAYDGTTLSSTATGDVTKVGTPANNQMAVWTGDGTLEGTADFTYDGTSLNLITGKNFQIAGSTILADSAGTTTLSNIDAIDATTETTIEAAIDTLANLTSIQGQTISLSAPLTIPADPNADRILFWDDSAGATAWLATGNSIAITTTTIDTIQDIRTTASPRFATLGVNKASLTTIGADIAMDATVVQGVRIMGAAASDLAFNTFVSGDAQIRFTFRADGQLAWGDGTSATDTNLYRNAANELKTDDAFVSATTITAGTGFIPDANDGAYLGTSALGFSDLFLAEGAVINWDNGDMTLTQANNILTLAGGEFNFGANTAYFTETDNGNSGTADTIDWKLSNKQKSTLTGNVTYTFTAPSGPCNLILKLVQDATGSRTVTWPASVKWPSGTAPTLTTTASRVDIISFYYDGTNYFGNSALNYTV